MKPNLKFKINYDVDYHLIGIRSKIQRKGYIKPEIFAEESNNAMTF